MPRIPPIGSPFALALALACTPEFPEVTWEGEHLHVAQSASGRVCGGSYAYQDLFVERLAELLGVTLDAPIRYAFVDPEEIQAYCFQDGYGGCYYDDKAYSPVPVLTHELAHAVADRAGWDGPRAFKEGFAEVFGFNSDTDVERLPIRGVIEDFVAGRDHYYTAALFVRFLVERYGLDRFGDFMLATDKDDEFSAIEASFKTHFGEPIDAAFAAFDAYPTCSAWANQAAIVECGMEPPSWDSDSTRITVSLDCGDEGTIGPFGEGSGLMSAARTLEIAEGGVYQMTVTSTSSARNVVRLSHCGSCWEAVDKIIAAGSTRTVELPPGRYFADFIGDVEEPMEITLYLVHLSL